MERERHTQTQLETQRETIENSLGTQGNYMADDDSSFREIAEDRIPSGGFASNSRA